jgi:hypothetical protein
VEKRVSKVEALPRHTTYDTWQQGFLDIFRAVEENKPFIVNVYRHVSQEQILEESKVQAKIVKNAARYLTGEAQEGEIAFGSTDNRKTYNNTSSVNLTGNNFYVRDEQDIRSLAVEIATLTRRQQRGRGLRMA